MVTIADVAARAGVAASTVSRVLSGKRFVSPDTSRAVHDAIRVLGYTPNVVARSLAEKRSNTVGLAVSWTANQHFADVIGAVELALSERGVSVMLINTRDTPEGELKAVRTLHERRVDAVILAPCCDPTSTALDYLHLNGVPTVLLDRLPASSFDGVGVENAEAVRRLVSHLLERGHREIGFIGGQATFTTAQERLCGFRLAIEEANLRYDPDLAVLGVVNADEARGKAISLLTRPRRITALFGGNNLATIGVLLAARTLGRRVPDDLSVVGFDDFDWAEAYQPRLTTIAQPCAELGRVAADLVQRRLAEPTAARRVVRLQPKLRFRDSIL